MISPNIRLVTNVLCVRMDNVRMNEDERISRLGYFELIEYNRTNSLLFPTNRLTDRHRSERDGPRGKNQKGLTRLWAHRPDLRPMPSGLERNPFESEEDPERKAPVLPKEQTKKRVDRPEIVPVALDAGLPEDIVSEQDAVMQAGTDSDMIVIAPPGTGKTHVLVERIAYLVGCGKSANPLAEILVLSFTRSAVAELRKRLAAKVAAGGDGEMLYAKIRTFDSLATQLLKLDLGPGAIESGFEQRIEQFNAKIRDNSLPNAEGELSKVRFLLVDEVQDLNGPRAEMVLELARRVSEAGGCSLFLGDPAQAIYDFADNHGQVSLTSVQFLENLIHGEYSGQPPRRVEFSQYRRFETPEILDFVHSARSAMGENGLSPDGAQLDELLRSLGKQLPLSDLAALAATPGRKALLTRTNLEAYWLWDYCRREGIPVHLWRGAMGNFWPGWIGRLALGFQSKVMSQGMALKRWNSHIAAHVRLSFAEAMDFLHEQGILDSASGQISISELNYLIGNSAPVQEADDSSEHIVISTIHRSKGLEFENVFLYAPSDGTLGKGGDEVRVVYVAATRAKQHLKLLSRNSSIVRQGQKNSSYCGLFTSGFHVFTYPSYPNIGLLIDGAEVVRPDSILSGTQPLDSQIFLWESCAAVPRDLVIEASSLICAGTPIGELESAIQKDISKIRAFRKALSLQLNGLVAHDLATVALDPDDTVARQSLGVACLGMVPVVSGIVSI